MIANSVYISNAGFFTGLWASIFGAPAWVGVVGGLAGGAIAAAVLAPMIGVGVERLVNEWSDVHGKFRAGYGDMCRTLVYGPGAGRTDAGKAALAGEGLLATSLEGFDSVAEVLDHMLTAGRFMAAKI